MPFIGQDGPIQPSRASLIITASVPGGVINLVFTDVHSVVGTIAGVLVIANVELASANSQLRVGAVFMSDR